MECIPYAFHKELVHGMSLEKQGSEGSLKCKLSEGSPN